MRAKDSVSGGAFTQEPSDEKCKMLYQVHGFAAAINGLRRTLFIVYLIRNTNQRCETM
jgi:hypothetical protein